MKSFYSSFFFALIGFLLVNTSPVLGQAATDTKVKKIPFHGKLQSVDANADTITLAGKKATRVFHLTSTTKITDGNGNPSTLSAAVVGEDVGGSYEKDSMTLFSVRFGAKPGSKEGVAAPATKNAASKPATAAAAPAATPPPMPAATSSSETAAAPAAAKVKKQSFSGKVVSVDAAANTLVVHGKADQTFTVTPATKISGTDGLASLAAGTKVSGSYSKSTDGATLTVYTLKVAK